MPNISWNVGNGNGQQQGQGQESQGSKSKWNYDDTDIFKVWFDENQEHGVGVKVCKMTHKETGVERLLLKFQTQWRGSDKRSSPKYPSAIPLWYTIPLEFTGQLGQALTEFSSRLKSAQSPVTAPKRGGGYVPPDTDPF